MEKDYFVVVDGERLEQFLAQAFQTVGVPPGDAELLSETLVVASLRGIDSHGVLLAYGYFKRLQKGGWVAKTETKVLSDAGCTAVISGGNGIGQVVSQRAMRMAIDKAKKYGVGVVGARNSNHFGAAGYWSMMALEHGMIGLSMTNTSPLMAPWGGTTAVLGSSPLAVAIPAGKEYPVVVDFATTTVAGGKLRVAAMRGEKIPIGWAVGPDSQATDDANVALKGRILPVGGSVGYKGFGLALIVDTLSAVLMGSAFGAAPALDAEIRDLGHYFQAINISSFMPLDEFAARMDDLLRQLGESGLEDGVDSIHYPGQKAYRTELERREYGLPLDGPVYGDLEKLSEELGIPLDVRRS